MDHEPFTTGHLVYVAFKDQQHVRARAGVLETLTNLELGVYDLLAHRGRFEQRASQTPTKESDSPDDWTPGPPKYRKWWPLSQAMILGTFCF